MVVDARKEWDKVRNRERYILKEINPVKLLPFLTEVLTDVDAECIKAMRQAHGNSPGVYELLRRLKKHGPRTFSTFISALREVGFCHTAQLLDPEFKVTAEIFSGQRDDRVFQAGVAADIRVLISLAEDTEEDQVEKVKAFCELCYLPYTDDTRELRRHFKDFVDENIQKYVNLVKTTLSGKNQLALVFRLSNVDAARTFWENFKNGDLKSIIKTKLQSFRNENNCFGGGDIKYDILVDPDDYDKVYETLENTEKCKVLVDGMEKQELKLRDYQIELVQPALDGKNTIICAPTGSGKTFVAMEAIKHRLLRDDKKLIAFIVNTVSLVEQQRNCLERYLPESADVSSLCGMNADLSRNGDLQDSHVVVMTAQMLVNALGKNKKDGEAENAISITDFSLLVFDECHHTTKDHPYNEIMRWYMKEKKENESPDLPQIIGLSASLGIGTGNGGNGCRAEDHILGLCANLDIAELQVYTEPQTVTCTKITPVSRDHSNVFHTTISAAMTKIEIMMLLCTRFLDKPSSPHGSQPYENWVVNMKKKDCGRDALTCAEQLDFYNCALMINDEVRIEDALQYLQENIISKESTDVEVELRVIFEDTVATILKGLESSESNPGLRKLEELLIKKLSGSEESKGIIFVRTRFIAEALVNWLKASTDLKDLVKDPTWLVGNGQRNGKVGMAKARQDRKIRDFRDGDCNVIVATSVLLEGVDFPKCNFSINYGMPGNEITHVQARGRVRTNDDGDTYDVIVSREQLSTREQDLNKEKLMNEAVAKVKEMGKDLFEKKVLRFQKQAYEEYVKKMNREPSQATPVPDDVDFHCRVCGAFACKAKHIKKFKSAFIVPCWEENLHNATFIDKGAGKPFCGDLVKTGKTLCKCGRDWGSRARNQYGDFPLLKIDSFRIKSESFSKTFSKWKEFPYELEEFIPENCELLGS